MSDDITKELQELEGAWEKAEQGGTSIPDGMYTFRVESTNVGKSQASGRLQMGMKLKIIVGEHTGKEIWNYQGLDNEKSMTWFKRNMVRLEVQLPDKLSELPTWCRNLVGITFQAQVKNKDGFCNVYPQRRVEVDETVTPKTGAKKLGM